MAEIVEVVKHQVHVLLLLTLQVVDYSLILMDLDPDVRVRLPGYGPGFDEAARLLVHIVAALRSGDVVPDIRVQPLLPPPHRLVVELATLLLQLVVAHVERVAAEAVVAHPHLILLSVQMVEHLVVVLVIIINAGIIDLLHVVAIRLDNVQTVVSLVVTIPVRSVVLVCVYLILLRLPASTIIIEHRVLRSARIVATHFHLSRILERQILLPLPVVTRVLARLRRHLVVLVIHLLLVVVLLGLRAVRRVLERQLRLRLVNIFLLEVFVIIIEYLVIDIEVLSGVQRPALVPLLALRQLLLR